MVDILTELRDTRGGREIGAALTQGAFTRGPGMLMLGRFMFSLVSMAPQQVSQRSSYRWPQQDIIGQRPVLQYLGPGTTEFELPGRIYPHYRGGLRQIAAMRELAGVGTVHLLMDALGYLYGDFAITEVEETQAVFGPGQVPRRQDFRIKLARADNDDAGGNAYANAFNTLRGR